MIHLNPGDMAEEGLPPIHLDMYTGLERTEATESIANVRQPADQLLTL